MSKRVGFTIKLMVLLTVAGILLTKMPVGIVKAANVDIGFYIEKDIINVGDSFAVELVLTAAETLGEFSGTVVFDTSYLELVYAPANFVVSDGSISIRDNGTGLLSGERRYLLRFKALKAGTSELGLAEKPTVSSLTNGLEMTAIITPKKVIINGSGENGQDEQPPVSVGTPTPIVTETPTSTPEVTRAASTTGETRPNENSGSKEEIQTGITVSLETYGTIVTEYHTYTCAYSMEGLMVPEGYEKTTLYIGRNAMIAYGKGKGSQEFLLLPLMNENNETGWYWYDRVEQTIQRVHEDDITNVIKSISYDQNLLDAIKEYEEKQNILLILASFFGVTSFVFMIIAIAGAIRNKMKEERPRNAKRRR